MTTVPRRLAVVVLAAMATGCALVGTGDPSAAAIVDDRRVDAAIVDEAVDGITRSPAFRQQQGDADQRALQTQNQLVTALVRSALLEEVAERNDITVSDADVDAAREQIVEQAGGQEALDELLAQQGVPPSLIDQQARDTALQAALTERMPDDTDLATFVRTELDGVPIEVNPRFGAWDPTTLAVEPADPLAPEVGTSAPPAVP